MTKAMVVSVVEGKQEAHFYSDLKTAIEEADIIGTCLGGYAEVYERQTPCLENDYDESYALVYCC